MTTDSSRRSSGQRAQTRRAIRAVRPRVPTAAAPLPPLLSERVGYLLWRGALRARQLAERALQPLRLRAPHYGLLVILSHAGPVSQQALGRQLGVDPSRIVALLDQLESQRLAERRRDPSDRRAYRIHVTAAGDRLLAQASRLTAHVEQELLARLTADERREFVAMLKTVVTGSSRAQ